MQTKLKKKYREFFKKFEIDEKTGCLNNNKKLKFPTFPYIGSKYGKAKRILIVGLDIGSDEEIGIKSFEKRQTDIEKKLVSKHNPHIAGTYFTALFFLKENLGWQRYWNKLKDIPSCKKALQKQEKLPQLNPLSYVALTNYYKFVSKNRGNKTGGENRVHLDKEFETNFFIDEVKIFNPDMIIFQSLSFKNENILLNKLLKLKMPIYIGPHPSYRGKRKPDYFIKKYTQVKRLGKT